MAYEYSSVAGTVRLVEEKGRLLLHFEGRRHRQWRSPDQAASAVARHRSGLPLWDRKRADAPEDLLDWRPLGGSL